MTDVVIAFNPKKKPGEKDRCRMTADGFEVGVGRDQAEATDAFFRANLEKFGVASLRVLKPDALCPDTTWKAPSP